ncbi:mitogen-activated protein kinase binding protein 1 [Physocladia obscura]|uniref:Mitogen-activated protein kinase binding protein 1 n=1 Tax=Physocladia obscura TaxID=109957 RepID=A0AAD5XGT2_9FUNG|nr:mitogen-activated protein kinase binding protein 1 [Physocladia obscura]
MIRYESATEALLNELRTFNSVIFPIKYNDSFYKAVLTNSIFCVLAIETGSAGNERIVGAVCCRREEAPPFAFVPMLLSPSIPVDLHYNNTNNCGTDGNNYNRSSLASLYIMTIGVLAPYRRLGIGSALLSTLVTRAATELSLGSIQLHVQTTNTDAMRFYAKHGFESVKFVEGYYRLNKGVVPPDAYLVCLDLLSYRKNSSGLVKNNLLILDSPVILPNSVSNSNYTSTNEIVHIDSVVNGSNPFINIPVFVSDSQTEEQKEQSFMDLQYEKIQENQWDPMLITRQATPPPQPGMVSQSFLRASCSAPPQLSNVRKSYGASPIRNMRTKSQSPKPWDSVSKYAKGPLARAFVMQQEKHRHNDLDKYKWRLYRKQKFATIEQTDETLCITHKHWMRMHTATSSMNQDTVSLIDEFGKIGMNRNKNEKNSAAATRKTTTKEGGNGREREREKEKENLMLDRVLGLGVGATAAATSGIIAVSSSSSVSNQLASEEPKLSDSDFLIAFTAGAAAVIWSKRKNKQIQFLIAPKPKLLACIAFASDKNLLAVGEINSICFDDSGYFITAGIRHFKYWNFDSSVSPIPSPQYAKPPMALQPQQQQIPMIEGIFATVGEHKNSVFMGIAHHATKSHEGWEDSHVYSVTGQGILVLFNEQRVNGGLSISVCPRFIVCGCTAGVIRLFEPVTMKYIATLPKPHHLGIDVAHSVGTSYISEAPPNALYPDVISVKVDAIGHYITCVYSDRSMFIWDVKDFKHIGKYRSFLSHNDCVWGAEMFPAVPGQNLFPSTPMAGGLPAQSPALPPHGLPPNTFTTYSSDLTIRFWNIETTPNKQTNDDGYASDYDGYNNQKHDTSENVNRYFRRNIYSKELLKVIYTNMDEFLAMHRNSEAARPSSDKLGIRSLKISSDGKLMAAGDRSGNLMIYELDTFSQQNLMEAHDGEILGIDFTQGNEKSQLPVLMATASRDRLIHIFDVNQSFSLIQTLDDHTSSITGVKFSEGGRKLISSAADKSIVFRSIQEAPGQHSPEFAAYHNTTGRSTIFDIDVDPGTEKNLAAVTQDRRLNIFSTATGKLVRTHTPSDDALSSDYMAVATVQSTSGILRVSYDPSGRYAVTAGADKCIRIFDLNSGVVVAKGYGHAEVITCVKFMLDCTRIVSTAGDGCVFVWKVSEEMTRVMKERLKKLGLNKIVGVSRRVISNDGEPDIVASVLPPIVGHNRAVSADIPVLSRDSSSGTDFMTVFNDEDDLPEWARSHKSDDGNESKINDKVPAFPSKGLWASRVAENGIELYSNESDHSKHITKFTNIFDRRFSIESSPHTLSRASTSGSIPSTDIVVEDIDDPDKSDDAEESVSGGSDENIRKEKIDDEPTIFVDVDNEIDKTLAVSDLFAISQHNTSESESDNKSLLAESKSETDVPAQPEMFTNNISDHDDDSDDDSANKVVDLTGKKVTLEEYYNKPVDLSISRQSISTKHNLLRDPSRRPTATGEIAVETVLSQIKEQQKSFENSVLAHQTGKSDVDLRVDIAPVQIASVDLSHVVDTIGAEMVEKKETVAMESPIRSPLLFSPGRINAPPTTAVNREAIFDGASVLSHGKLEYDSDDFEPLDDSVDSTQVLKDLRRLKNLTDASASLLRRLEKAKTRTEEEEELSQEIRTTLGYVRESAASALEAVCDSEQDSVMAAMLEKYSDVLVGLVREKLTSKDSQ